MNNQYNNNSQLMNENRYVGPFLLGSLNGFANTRPIRPYPSWYRPYPPRPPRGPNFYPRYPFRFF